jgi:hypothetical protein
MADTEQKLRLEVDEILSGMATSSTADHCKIGSSSPSSFTAFLQMIAQISFHIPTLTISSTHLLNMH